MNTVHLATITKGGQQVYQFAHYDNEGRANYLAGVVMDRLCDYHGGDDWDYSVTPLPYAASISAEWGIIEHALSKAVV